MVLTLDKVIQGIEPLKDEWRQKARSHIDNLTMPRGSLGEVLVIAERLAAIKETLKPSVSRKAIVTMAGDHGVVEEGVSAYPQEVTPQMVANFVAGGAAINVLASVAGARVIVVDMGVAQDLGKLVQQGKILSYKVDYGTKNMCKGPAMTREQAVQSLEAGIRIACHLVEEGVELLGTGDMGIGNTTPSSAILAALSGLSVAEITGRGTGVDDVGLSKKIQAIKKALEINKPDPNDAVDVLAKVGGFEIGGIAGLILGAAYCRVPVVVDGLISTAGALLAHALAPASADYMFAGHVSREPGHRHMLRRLGLRPLLDLDLRLGEGTGAALAMPIIEGAAQVIGKMATFEQASVSRSVEERQSEQDLIGEGTKAVSIP
ncbi:MAG: nicotinate-nucleotide--dimethylbenzimidazole phosphoribosyltransferase [Syntrophothermus sp.]|uniref:nicotinate-nucleotide--dimethylbenzimidazole phosphoribosyltransferase n=1 Tax=Syntrophothermus sp. TaxID=2736299 RepID=UPI00257CC5DF|nr:nicotinate-nucleotide--dimethylbenzimidazole phosphoribosyltransferase [Syntrophothermus sp.]NSW81705.1 nicotinate-nucleotide--dimethylbenzimidazole phosphoribosyltransferase [Syntrophothermus sp.]